MRELNFAEIAAVSGGESSLSLVHGFDQPTDGTSPKGLLATGLRTARDALIGEAAVRGVEAVFDGIKGLFGGSTSSTGGNRGGSHGTDGTSNSGDGHGF